MPSLLLIKNLCKKVVPDLGFPTINIGFLKIELFGKLINILSINKKNETKNFIKVSNKPVKMVDSQTPNVLPIILYAFSLLFIFEMLI